MDWRKALIRLLKELNIIHEAFTGKLIINMNQGNITDIEKTERIK